MKFLKQIVLLMLLMVSRSSFAANDLDGFIKACVSSAGLDVEICRCVAQRADQELSPQGFQFIYANIARNKEIIESLRWRLKEPDLNKTTAFMANAPQQCAETIHETNQEEHMLQ